MKLIVKYFFLAGILEGGWVAAGGVFILDTFSLGRRVLSGGHLRLESSCIWVNMVLMIEK